MFQVGRRVHWLGPGMPDASCDIWTLPGLYGRQQCGHLPQDCSDRGCNRFSLATVQGVDNLYLAYIGVQTYFLVRDYTQGILSVTWSPIGLHHRHCLVMNMIVIGKENLLKVEKSTTNLYLFKKFIDTFCSLNNRRPTYMAIICQSTCISIIDSMHPFPGSHLSFHLVFCIRSCPKEFI